MEAFHPPGSSGSVSFIPANKSPNESRNVLAARGAKDRFRTASKAAEMEKIDD